MCTYERTEEKEEGERERQNEKSPCLVRSTPTLSKENNSNASIEDSSFFDDSRTDHPQIESRKINDSRALNYHLHFAYTRRRNNSTGKRMRSHDSHEEEEKKERERERETPCEPIFGDASSNIACYSYVHTHMHVCLQLLRDS